MNFEAHPARTVARQPQRIVQKRRIIGLWTCECGHSNVTDNFYGERRCECARCGGQYTIELQERA